MVFQASGGFWRIRASDNWFQIPTMFTVATTEFRENLHAVHARHIRTLDEIAEGIFLSSKIREGETGVRPGGGRMGRQTGRFSFGGRASAFQGRLSEEGKKIGFGWPDIDTADRATEFVWRSLEFGLWGSKHRPEARTQAGSQVMPRGHHELPRRFSFVGGGPKTSTMVIGGGNTRQFSQRHRSVLRTTREQEEGTDKTIGAGIQGKHFIEGAWEQAKIGDPKRYREVVKKSFRAFR